MFAGAEIKIVEMYKKQLLIIPFLSSLLISCASVDEKAPVERDLTDSGSDCISIRTIRDYIALGRNSLIIEGSGNRLYYVTLSIASFQLRNSYQVGVQSRDDWLCPYGGDRLIFDGGGYSADRHRIHVPSASIRGIMRLTPNQADDLLIRHGKKEVPEQQDLAPPELKGAEVEELGEKG